MRTCCAARGAATALVSTQCASEFGNVNARLSDLCERFEPHGPCACLSVEIGVAQEAPDEHSDFILPDACHNDTVPGVPQTRLKKAGVPREKSGIPLSSQQSDNFFVFHSLSAKVEADLYWLQSPRVKQEALSIQDVLVKNNQACARSSTYSGAVYSSE